MAETTSAATITVLIPAPLRRFTDGAAQITASGTTIAELIDALETAHPGIRERICESDGRIRRFVNIFVNGTNIRTTQGAETPLASGDEVGIVPAMAGGC